MEPRAIFIVAIPRAIIDTTEEKNRLDYKIEPADAWLIMNLWYVLGFS